VPLSVIVMCSLSTVISVDASGDYLHDFTRLCSRKDSLQEILGRSAMDNDSGFVLFVFGLPGTSYLLMSHLTRFYVYVMCIIKPGARCTQSFDTEDGS